VTGYSDKESMWEKLWSLNKTELPPSQHPNWRSPYWLQLADKAMKLKKYIKPVISKKEEKILQKQQSKLRTKDEDETSE
jgi:hypothetical protein